MKIYLSPANHHKPYANGSTEKTQMEKLAKMIKEKLESRYIGVFAYLPTVFSQDQDYTGRPHEADLIGADYYIALHTNASGNKASGGTATGACGFYHPNYPKSKELAKEFVLALNAICPFKSNRSAKPAIYAQWQHINLGELREPAMLGMCPMLVEHEFHDRLEGANWIVDSLEDIAEADVRAIAKVLNLRKKSKKGDVNGDGNVDNLDAAIVLKYDAGLTELTDEQQKVADINGDGEVNNLDAAQILREDAGL